MAAKAGVYISVLGDSKVAVQQIDAARRELDRLEQTAVSTSRRTSQSWEELQRTGDRLSSMGNKLMLGLTLPLVAGFAMAIREATEFQQVNARTENVLATTGGVANVTSASLGRLANRIQENAAVSDDLVRSAGNVLLTFTGVRNEVGRGNDIFDRALKLAVDMSRALGTDLQSAAIQVGKALNDPIKGVTALQRVGVSFTETQRSQIRNFVESGDVMSAQKVVIAELGKEFGGAAEAMATPGDRLKVSMAELAETVGIKLMPVFQRAVDVAAKIADWFQGIPDWAQNALVIGAVMTAAVGPVLKLAGVFFQARAALVRYAMEQTTVTSMLGSFGDTAMRVAGRLTVGISAYFALSAALRTFGVNSDIATAAAMTFAGAITGGWVGAAIGGILGLVAAFGRAKDHMREFNGTLQASIQEMRFFSAEQAANEFLKLGDAALEANEKMFETFDDIRIFGVKAGEDFNAGTHVVESSMTRLTARFVAFQEIARSDPAAAKLVIDGLRARGMATDMYENALRQVIETSKRHDQANGELTRSFADLEAGVDDTTSAVDDFTAALQDAVGLPLDMEQANIRWHAALANVAKQLVTNGRSLDVATEAGRANRESITAAAGAALRFAEAMVRQTGDTRAAADTLLTHSANLAEVMRQTGLTEAEIRDYLFTLGLTPEQVMTFIGTVGVPGARWDIATVRAALDHVAEGAHAVVTANTDPAIRAIADFVNCARSVGITADAFQGIIGIAYFQAGGLVPGPVHEAVPAILHGGEYVLSADIVDRIRRGVPSRGATTDDHARFGLSTAQTAVAQHHTHYHVNATGSPVTVDETRLVELLSRLALLHSQTR